MVAGLFSLVIGICIRSIPQTFFLLTGTLFIGAGISIGNVLLPAIVKDKFPQKFGLMTSVYSTSMGLVASLASGVSVPLAKDLSLGWQGALIVWGVPALLAIVLWSYLLKFSQGDHEPIIKENSSSAEIWRSPLAWQIALFMGSNPFCFTSHFMVT